MQGWHWCLLLHESIFFLLSVGTERANAALYPWRSPWGDHIQSEKVPKLHNNDGTTIQSLHVEILGISCVLLDLDLYTAGTISDFFCNGACNANIKKFLKGIVCVVSFYSPYFKYLKTG